MLCPHKLEKRGFDYLGKGICSIVIAKSGSDRVIKINTNPDSWAEFMIWGQKLNSPYMPILYSLKQYEDARYVAVYERVKVGPADNEVRQVMNECMSAYAFKDRYGDMPEHKNPRFKGLFPFLRALVDRFGEKYNDLHKGNYGHRDDGSLVIFDPIFDSYDVAESSYSSRRYKRVLQAA